MRKPVLISLVVAATIVVSVIIVSLFPPRFLIDRVEVAMTQASGMPVTIGSWRLTVFPVGLSLIDVKIGQQPSAAHPMALSLDQLKVGLRLWPLLKSHIAISEVVLRRPQLELLMISDAADSELVESVTENEASARSDFSLALERLVIRDGEVVVWQELGRTLVRLAAIDQDLSASLDTGQVARLKSSLRIGEMLVNMPGGSLGQGLALLFNTDLSYDMAQDVLSVQSADLQLGELGVSLAGQVAKLTTDIPSVDLTFSGGPTQVQSILAYLPANIFPMVKGVTSRGVLAIKGHVKGDLDPRFVPGQLDYSFDFKLDQGSIKYPDLPTVIDEIAVHVVATPELVDIKNFSAKAAKSSLFVQGSVANYLKQPQFNLNTQAQLQLAEIAKMQNLPGDLAGQVKVNMRLLGTAQQPEAKGAIVVDSLKFAPSSKDLPSLNRVSAHIELDTDAVYVRKISGDVDKSDISVKGSVQGWRHFVFANSRNTTTQFSLDLHSKFLDLDALMPAPAQDNSQDSSINLSVLDGITGKLQIAGDKVVFNRIHLQDVSGTAVLKNGVFDLSQFVVKCFGGSIQLSGQADYRNLKRPLFDVSLGLNQIKVNEFFSYAVNLNRFAQLGQFVQGSFSAQTSFKGALTDEFALDLSSLASKGKLQFANGVITGHPVQNALASFMQTDKLKKINFQNWAQPFEIGEGALNVKDMKLKAQDFALSVKGRQQVDGPSAFDMNVTLPKAWAEGMKGKLPSQAAQLLFAGPGSTLDLPFKVSGTLLSPQLALNNDLLMSQVEARAKSLLKQQLDDRTSQVQSNIENKVQSQIEKQGQGQAKEQIKKNVEKVVPKPDQSTKDNVKERIKKLF